MLSLGINQIVELMGLFSHDSGKFISKDNSKFELERSQWEINPLSLPRIAINSQVTEKGSCEESWLAKSWKGMEISIYDFKHMSIINVMLIAKILLTLLPSLPSSHLLWKPYPSHHNGLFSPLLVLKDFTAREADQYWCYPNSTRLLTFSM